MSLLRSKDHKVCARCGALALLIVLVTVSVQTGASETKSDWVDAVGEAVADDSRPLSEIKQEALAKARRHAIEQVVGTKVQGETLVRDFALQSDFVASLSSGTVIEEKVIRWDTETVKTDGSSAPVLMYRVVIRARVALEKGEVDPAFKIKAGLNRNVFKDGDDVVLRVKSTRDCYLTIFTVTEQNNVFLVLPNRVKKNNFMKEGEELVYPTEREMSRGLTLKAGLLPGCQKTKESFRIIATKRPIHFTPDTFAEAVGIESFQNETATVAELVRELMTIPTSERAEAFVAYEIVK